MITSKGFAQVELLNPVAKFYQRKDGNLYTLTFQVHKELWDEFEEPTPGLRLGGILYVIEDNEEAEQVVEQAKENVKAKAEPKPKGPYRQFWRVLCKDGFFSCALGRGFIRYLRDGRNLDESVSDEDVMRVCFGFSSRTFIDPETLAGKLDWWSPTWRETTLKSIFDRAVELQNKAADQTN